MLLRRSLFNSVDPIQPCRGVGQHCAGTAFLRRIACANRVAAGLTLLLLSISPGAFGQANSQPANAEKGAWVGDSPAIAPAMATDLSARLKRKDLRRAIEKVADWELERARPHFSQQWTFAALYTGFMAVPEEANGKKYRAAMLEMAKSFQAQPGPRVAHADDLAIGQTYLDLYARTQDAALLKPIRERVDALMQLPDDAQKPLWWWCDALFMAPPVLVKLSQATGERKYLDFMDHEWWITSDLLYSPKNDLYFRDKSFFASHEANGNSIFWARGNGWVFAGLARVLAQMPADYPTRPKYVAQFRAMAKKLASLQGADGLWRPGLLDAEHYQLPENSGSAFNTYGFAYGINAGILDRKTYKPVVEKAWKGLLSHVYEDGRLGCIQPIGAAPGAFVADSSYVYGTGAFLLAGSEIYHLAR